MASGSAILGRERVAGAAVLLLAGAAALALELTGAPPVMARSVGLVILAIGFWALGVLAEALTGLIFVLGIVLVAGIAPGVAFSGYTTTAFWLVFAGAVISASANRTGLSAWLGGLLAGRLGPATGYTARIAGVVIFASALALVLPSTMARVAILVPLVLAMCDATGFGPGSRGRTGLVLAAAVGTYVVPITFLPANVPNMVLAGSLEAIHGVSLSFGSYLVLHFPVIGLVKGVALVAILSRLFRDTPAPGPAAPEAAAEAAPARGLSATGRRLLLLLVVTLGLWASDAIHGISPAWIGLAAAVICLLPATGILRLPDLPSQSVLPMLIYIGAVLGIGAVVTESGAGAWLSGWMLAWLPLAEASDFARLAMLAGMATLTGLATTMPAAPAITAPLFGEIAAQTGWSIEAVGLSQVLGYATPLMPYQVPPIMVAIAMTGIAAADAIRTMVLLALVTSPVVLALAHPWWSWLGWY